METKKQILRIIIRKLINESFMRDPINVFHGTDRDFDEFDVNKIGSGDGKSLGGWGIYFSDKKDVSQRYFLKGGFVKEFTIKNGNLFDLDEGLDEENASIILNRLSKKGINEDSLEQFQSDFIDYIPDITNKQVYEWLTYTLGSEKNASLFIESMGYMGNKFKDKWDSEATNYVIFNPKYVY